MPGVSRKHHKKRIQFNACYGANSPVSRTACPEAVGHRSAMLTPQRGCTLAGWANLLQKSLAAMDTPCCWLSFIAMDSPHCCPIRGGTWGDPGPASSDLVAVCPLPHRCPLLLLQLHSVALGSTAAFCFH